MRRCTGWVLAIIVLLAGCPGFAGAASATRSTDDWHISILTFGPGPLIFERYGHVAIRLKNDPAGVDVCYDWGNFSFDDPNFLARFAQGDLRYWMAGKDTARMLEVYITEWDRTVTEQALNLTPTQNLRIRELIEGLDDDQHRFYAYDYFRDNCATRVRDALDDATGGALKRSIVGQTPHSYRWQDRRLVPVGAANVALAALMDFAGGPRIDVPLTRWESCFLPTVLADELDSVRVVGASGETLPLVLARRKLNATRSPGNVEPAAASNPIWWTLPIGLTGAAVLVACSRYWVIGFKLIASAWEGFVLVGSLLTLAMIAFTTHWPVVWNQNLLQFTPLSAIVLAAVWRTAWRPILMRAVWAAVLLSLVGTLVTLSHLALQVNAPAIALCLPLHAAVLFGLRSIVSRSITPSPEPPPVRMST